MFRRPDKGMFFGGLEVQEAVARKERTNVINRTHLATKVACEGCKVDCKCSVSQFCTNCGLMGDKSPEGSADAERDDPARTSLEMKCPKGEGKAGANSKT